MLRQDLPVTDDGATLRFVDSDIWAVTELVTDEGSGEDASTDTDSNDRVGGNISEPDWLVLDVLNNLSGGEASGSTAKISKERKKKCSVSRWQIILLYGINLMVTSHCHRRLIVEHVGMANDLKVSATKGQFFSLSKRTEGWWWRRHG